MDGVAVVLGATRGCGRGIAVELGALGLTVYAAGRSTRAGRSELGRPETVEETAELVDAAGGRGVPVRCDATDPAAVAALRARIEADTGGRLDVLVADAWGGDGLVQHGVPLWESDVDRVVRAVRNGLESHLVGLHGLLPLLVARGGGLVVAVTDGDDDRYHGPALPYYLVKGGIRRLAVALAGELAGSGVTALAVTPGYLRSEAMLANFGVTEANWRDAIAQDRHYALAESPRYLGRAVAALAADADVARFAGQCLASWTLMREYGFTDVDGSRPDWGRWFADVIDGGQDPAAVDAAAYR